MSAVTSLAFVVVFYLILYFYLTVLTVFSVSDEVKMPERK